MLIGYARVSTNDQDTTAQASALKAAGCERIFREKATLTTEEAKKVRHAMKQIRQCKVAAWSVVGYFQCFYCMADLVPLWDSEELGREGRHK